MHKSGFIHLHNDNIHLQTVLFDSGAIQSNYIDEQFVNNNIVHLKPFLQPLKHSVKVGDNKTQLELSYIITIRVSFIDSTLISHEATINCSLMPMPGTTLVIGLPTILFHFFDLFTDLLRQAQKTIIHTKKQTEPLSSHSQLNLSTSSLINTRTLPQDIIASEDTETPQPCSFTGPLHYLGKPYLEAVQQYKDLISTHVSSQFLLAVPDLADFLVKSARPVPPFPFMKENLSLTQDDKNRLDNVWAFSRSIKIRKNGESDAPTICAICGTHLILSDLLLHCSLCKTAIHESCITTHNTGWHHNDNDTICKNCYLISAIDNDL